MGFQRRNWERQAFVLGVIVLSLFVFIPSAHAGCNCFNVTTNPSFEMGLNSGNPYPFGWGNWTKHGGVGSSITLDNSTAVDGFYSAKLNVTSLVIGFIALTQDLPSNTMFRNVTDRPDSIDVWFKVQPKYAGMGDVRLRILHGENVGELNYVFDRDPTLYYPNSTTYDEQNRPTGVKSILISTSTLPTAGQWFHFQRNLRADWQAPLLFSNGTYMGPGFDLDITFQRVQFDALSFQNTQTGAYYSEVAWVDNYRVWLDINPSTPPLLADFTFNPSSPTTNTAVDFTATPSGGVGPYTYIWKFGDDNSTRPGNPVSHTFSSTGTFLVTLTVTDSMLTTRTIGHAVTVVAPRYSLVYNFTDQNGAVVDRFVVWKLFNSTDQALNYRLGDSTLVSGLYTVRAYYPREPYLILEKQIRLDGSLLLSIPLALVPENTSGDFIALNNAVLSGRVILQNSTMLKFDTAGSASQYVIVAKVGFLPQSVIRIGSTRVLLSPNNEWSFDPGNSVIKIVTTELGGFTISGTLAPQIPIVSFVDLAGHALTNVVSLKMTNSLGNVIDAGFQGQIPPDENFPYNVEAVYKGHTVYRSILTMTTDTRLPHIFQLGMVSLGPGGSYLVVNRTVASISAEYTPSRITFTIQGTGPSLIVVDVPARPLYVERNGARIASWTYDSQTNTIAIETEAEGSFAIVLPAGTDYSVFLLLGGVSAIAAIAAVLIYQVRLKKMRKRPGPIGQ